MDSNSNQSSSQPKYMDFVRGGGINNASKTQQPSKTLMRSAVKPPLNTAVISSKSALVTKTPSSLTKIVAPKIGVSKIDPSRQARAVAAQKSNYVSRFGSTAISSTSQPQISALSNKMTNEIQPPVAPPFSGDVSSPKMSIFEKNIAQATSHSQPPIEIPKSKESKLLKGMGVTLIAILVIGVVVNLNLKRIDVYLATAKAGFAATLPGLSPSGFNLAKVTSAAGVIKTSYKSNSNGSIYSITEKPSLWDSSTLLDSYVQEIAGNNYQVYQSDGIKIFIYGNKNATWVDNGIWYVVSSNGGLSVTEITNMATSM